MKGLISQGTNFSKSLPATQFTIEKGYRADILEKGYRADILKMGYRADISEMVPDEMGL